MADWVIDIWEIGNAIIKVENIPVIVSSYWLSCWIQGIGSYNTDFILLGWISVYKDIFAGVVID